MLGFHGFLCTASLRDRGWRGRVYLNPTKVSKIMAQQLQKATLLHTVGAHGGLRVLLEVFMIKLRFREEGFRD